MDLDRAMVALARPFGAEVGDQEVTERVRTDLLSLLAGRPVAGLSAGDEAAIGGWIRQAFRSAPDPAAALYQVMLARVVVRTSDGFTVRRDRKSHRATGAYYTDGVVARYILRRAKAVMPDVRSVIDPACGAGAFLVEARNQWAANPPRLVGLDADPRAVQLCRQQLDQAELHRVDALLEPFLGGFDLCVGNPPYISTGLRGAAPSTAHRITALRARFPTTAQYKLNTYPLFVERGLELLRPGGVLGYVLPDSFLSGRYYEGLRRLLLQHTLLELSLVCEDFWEHGRVGQSVILLVRKGPPPPDHRVTIKVCRSLVELDAAPGVGLSLSELAWGPLCRFRLIPDGPIRTLVAQMESTPGGRPLGSLLRAYSGLIGRRGQSSLLRSRNPGMRGPWGRLLRSGKEIDRYWLEWAGEEVCLDPNLIKSGGRLAYYDGPKLLLRQTADSLRAVYDEQGHFCLNNIHVLVPRAVGTDLLALLAVINSSLIDRYYRALTMESGRLYAQVDLDLLGSLPIPPITLDQSQRLADLVRQRQSATSQQVAPLEETIDQLVRSCYGLTLPRR